MDDLKRYIEEYKNAFPAACSIIRSADSEFHVHIALPVLLGTGYMVYDRSQLKDYSEAKAYYKNEYLRNCIIDLSLHINQMSDEGFNIVFSHPYDWNLQACMTLFSKLSDDETVFDDVINRFFSGKKDIKTVTLIKQYIDKDYKRTKNSELFVPIPDTWGLRGDPFFWEYLFEKADEYPVFSSEDEIRDFISREYVLLTGEELTQTSCGYVKSFAHGGLSSGRISGKWWVEMGTRLLSKNLIEK